MVDQSSSEQSRSNCANCPPPAGTPRGAIPLAGDVEKLRVPVFGGGDEDAGSEVTDVSTLIPVGGAKEASVSSDPPFILSEGLPPVPHKLVKKIQKGDYVDMAELLRDNMELGRRQSLEAGLGGGARPSRREVPDLLSWIACFGMYASVVAQKYPHRVRELWAYQTLVVHEARRCGGKGWQVYDSMFRQQAANNPKVNWSVLNSSLYSTSFLAMQTQRGRACQHCMETDHASQACALVPTIVSKTGQGQGFAREYDDQRRQPRDRTKIRRACFNWNEGKCDLPYCRFKHVCAKCGGCVSGCSYEGPPLPRTATGGFTT